jgi:hypothetical protein
MTQKCQHIGCENISFTGVWCKECIESEWQSCAVGDGHHWIGWKVAWQKAENLFIGAFGAPYEVGEVTIPFGLADWLLSPLGALKEVVKGANRDLWKKKEGKIYIIAGIVAIKNVELIVQQRADESTLFLRGNSPCLVLGAYSLSEFPIKPRKAIALLDGMRDNPYCQQEVDRWEQRLRPTNIPSDIFLPPPIPVPGPLGHLRQKVFHQLISNEGGYSEKLKNKIMEILNESNPLSNFQEESEQEEEDSLRRFRKKTVSTVREMLGPFA